MKKYLYLILLILIFAVGVWLLNTFGVVSIQAWGEKAITSTPFLKDYVQTNEAYNRLFADWQDFKKENNDLKNTNDQLQRELTVAKEQIKRQETEIKDLEQKLTDLKNQQQTREDKLNKLVKIYSNMEPAEAANIFISLDRELVLQLLTHLKEDKAAAILTNLSPEMAAEFSKALQ